MSVSQLKLIHPEHHDYALFYDEDSELWWVGLYDSNLTHQNGEPSYCQLYCGSEYDAVFNIFMNLTGTEY